MRKLSVKLDLIYLSNMISLELKNAVRDIPDFPKPGILFKDITPILKDDEDDLIQVFSGEWYYPGIRSSGMFFEFVQRKPSQESLSALQEANRELWFRDKTFLGLYGEKEQEYQSGNVVPFLDFALFEKIEAEIKDLKVWQITQAHLDRCESIMLEYAKNKTK